LVSFKDDFKTLDPAIGYDTSSWSGERAIFNGLLDYDGFTTKLKGDIATDVPTPANSGKTYTFHLRHGVMFQAPYKREVTAQDFKYSWERMLDPATAGPMTGGPFWGGITGAQDFFNGKAKSISGIKVIDNYTLEVDLDTPNQAFLNIVAMPFGFVVPKEAVQAAGSDFAHHVVGTGPYMLDHWTPGQVIVLKKNPNYFGTKPYLDEVDLQIGITPEVGILRMKQNQLDLPEPEVNMPTAQYDQLKADPSWKGQLVTTPNVDIWYLAMNVNMKPFNDVRVREAFNYVVNKANQAKILGGRGIINNGIYPPPMPGYVNNYNPLHLDANGQDIAKAKSLLTQAGYGASNPFPTQTLVYAKANADSDRLAASVQQDFKAVGVNVNLQGLAFNAFLDVTGKPNTTAFSYNGWIQDFPDPSDFYDPILSCSSANVTANGGNVAFFCDKSADSIADQARGNTNSSDRLKQYDQLQDIVASKDFPWVPMYSTVEANVYGKRVHGYRLHPVWPLVLTTIWVTGASSSAAPTTSASASSSASAGSSASASASASTSP
jgi:ABC-type transport system substrate-binding protein